MKLSRITRRKSLFSIYLIISYLVISCVWTSFYVHVVAGDAVHDIAITNVTTNTTVVAPGETVEIIVQVENQGDFNETFNVKAYYNSSLIGTQNVDSLNASDSTLLTFVWDTTGVPESNNIIKANATVVSGETETTDNEYVDGTVTVTWTKLYVSPTPVSKNTGVFVISINIDNVTDLWSFAFRLSWKRGLLSCQSAVEGPFLSKSGTQNTWFIANIDPIASLVSITNRVRSGGTSVNGSGTLVNISFLVTDTGNCTLELDRVRLTDSNGVYMPPNTGFPDYYFTGFENGYFYTTYPVASFTMSPDPGIDLWRPIVGETVTFNASESYDPDDPYDSTPGGIVSYYWDFGDDTNVTVNDPITPHTYTTNDTYKVVLTVTDDETENDSDEYYLDIKLHDIALINVTAYPTEVATGATVTINATVLNKGSVMEYLNISAYYISPPYAYPVEERIFNYTIDSQVKVTLSRDKNGTTTIFWDTTGVAPGTYMIGAKVWLIQDSGLYRGVSLDEWEANKTDNEMFAGPITIVAIPVHDLAVTAVTVDPVNIPFNQAPHISVKVRNQGNFNEIFNVTVYCNSTLIGMESDVPLFPGASKPLTFEWAALTGTNTTQEGVYIIMANVTKIANETDIDDNSLNITKTMRLLPYPNFIYSPTPPAVGQTITFDASSSYSPGIPAPGELPGIITSYKWDFGDGTTSTGKFALQTHTYNKRGTYSVTLTVTDIRGLTETYWETVSVGHDHDVAVIDVTPLSTEATSGGQVSVNVTVTNKGTWNETFTVFLYYDDTQVSSQSVTDLVKNANTTLTFAWDTTGVAAGTYTIEATASQANETETYLEDNTLLSDTMVTITKLSSSISISASPTTLTIGGSTTLNGSITPKRAGVTVTIWIRTSEGDWSEEGTVTTDANGDFSYSWKPPSAGSYGVKVSWPGDDETYAAESDVQVVDVQEALTSNMFLYSTIAFAVLSAVIAVYFIWIKKPKPA